MVNKIDKNLSVRKDIKERSLNKKVVLFKKKIKIFFISFLVICIFFIFVLNLDDFRLKSFDVIGEKIVRQEDVQDLLQKQTRGKYFLIFPKNSYFLLPEKKIKKDIFEYFPIVKEVNFEKVGNNHLITNIKERNPFFVWCMNEATSFLSVRDGCFFADNEGFLFSKAPYFSGPVYFVFFNSQNIIKNIGEYAYQKDELEYFFDIKNKLNEIGIDVFAFDLSDEKLIKIFINHKSVDGGFPAYLILNKDNNYDLVIDNLLSALEEEPLRSSFVDNFNNVLYIDLRFNNRVVYKFR